jgi:hypothetical protein
MCCCTHHLAYFHATPLRYCKSSKPINVSWFTDARSVTLTATPPIPEVTTCKRAATDTLQFQPQATSIQLDFGETDNRPVKVIAPLGPDDSALMKGGFVAACVQGAVVAPFEFDADEYAPEVIVAALQNPLGAEIVVEHAGATWTIAPGARVAVTPDPSAPDDPSRHLSHTWTIRQSVPGGCANSTSRPDKLGVLLTLECSP